MITTMHRKITELEYEFPKDEFQEVCAQISYEFGDKDTDWINVFCMNIDAKTSKMRVNVYDVEDEANEKPTKIIEKFHSFHEAAEILIKNEQDVTHFVELYGNKRTYSDSDIMEFIVTINGYEFKV